MSASLRSHDLTRSDKQSRSERTRAAILDAAEQLIAEKGYAAATLSGISRRAGVTVGAFYGRFDGKDALLRELHERLREQTWLSFEPLWEALAAGTLTFREALERSMLVMVWLYREKGALVRALNQVAATNPALKKRLRSFNRTVCVRLYDALAIYSHHITHPTPQLAMKLGHEAGMRLLRGTILLDEIDLGDLKTQGFKINDQLLAREAARMWEAYLSIRPDAA